MKRIAITGAAGQIAYSLLFRIAHGDLFGPAVPVALHLLEVPQVIDSLHGVIMELNDCCFPLLSEIKIGSDPYRIFEGVDIALLIGSKPRGAGMERKDLLTENGKIFVEQGRALNKAASKELITLVVGNPCNTNCLIAMHHAPDLQRSRFQAMTRLDQNRATSFLAAKAGVPVSDVQQVAIWGNHSSTQVPDFFHAQIGAQPALDVIEDHHWLQTDFISKVQKRGAEIIQVRGKSSAASAASAIIDALVSLTKPSSHWFSTAVYSRNNPYGIHPELVFSFPCRLKSYGDWEIIKDLELPPLLQEKIKLTEKELLEERELVRSLL